MDKEKTIENKKAKINPPIKYDNIETSSDSLDLLVKAIIFFAENIFR